MGAKQESNTQGAKGTVQIHVIIFFPPALSPTVSVYKCGMDTLMRRCWRSVPASSMEPTVTGPSNN